MASAIERTYGFRFASTILRRLGEELVPSPDQGIVELVRNSYDADAVQSTVHLTDTERPGGTVTIVDDGLGMTQHDIENGWLVLGKSAKTTTPTPLGRLPVGEKGLGRLAALRLGTRAVLRTRPKSERGVEYEVIIDWRLFERSDLVEDVPIRINRVTTSKASGTTVEITDLKSGLGRQDVKRLARSLLLLSDPFREDPKAFKPTLVAPAFSDLEKRVRDAYFEEAEYHLTAAVNRDGRAHAAVLDWKGKPIWTAQHDELSKGPYRTVPAKFDLWAFKLDGQSFQAHNVTVTEVRDWLDVVGGVHVYERELRVHPYGDQGNDWLEMNLRRVRSPEERPSTNNSLGRVVIPEVESQLIQKTDRSGFVENEAYAELRRFAIDALDWMAKERLRAAELRRQSVKARVPKTVTRAQRGMQQALSSLPASTRQKVQSAVTRLEAARRREAELLKEEVQLYRMLSTIGTTIAVFAHEAAKPVSQIEKMAQAIERRGKSLLKASYKTSLEKPVDLILRSARALQSFARLPLRLLDPRKRRRGRVEIHAVISDVLLLFEPFLVDAKINMISELSDGTPVLLGTVSALESIVANLITNTVNAFNFDSSDRGPRRVVVKTTISGQELILKVLDNGPGIVGISLDDIWLPGRTTVPGGTGLGLTIVRDATIDLGGRVSAVAKGELGGAEFVVTLPLTEGSR